MVSPHQNEKDVVPVIFKSFRFLYNFIPGSRASMELHNSLHQTRSKTIFESEAIRILLKYKWDLVRGYAYFGAILSLVLVVLLFIFNEMGRDYQVLMVPILLLGLLFMIIDLFQMVQNIQAYLTSFWNLFDLLRFFFIVIFACVALTIEEPEGDREERDDEYYYYILAILNFIAWIRLLSYLRLFRQTRALIRLVVEVCKDMIAFLIVLFCAIITFSIILRITSTFKET
mmetsp:Transcript_39910/g.38461  ORF Transcript_39910/g.38461 Transcript_39910/m.38461 type:complete len:229 (-) Transcript_39910:558-1244(-)